VGGLGKEDIERVVKEAQLNAEVDKERQKRAEVRCGI